MNTVLAQATVDPWNLSIFGPVGAAIVALIVLIISATKEEKSEKGSPDWFKLVLGIIMGAAAGAPLGDRFDLLKIGTGQATQQAPVQKEEAKKTFEAAHGNVKDFFELSGDNKLKLKKAVPTEYMAMYDSGAGEKELKSTEVIDVGATGTITIWMFARASHQDKFDHSLEVKLRD